MLSFSQYIQEATLSAGVEAERHAKKYLDPIIGDHNAVTVKKEHGSIPAGAKVTVHGYGQDDKGKWHAHVSHDGKKEHVPFGKIEKPHSKEVSNKGFDYENNFVERLKKRGVMPSHVSAAGSTGGTDFVAHDKKKESHHLGKVTSSTGHSLHLGETKLGHTAAFGQLTIHHTDEKGWHISDRARSLRPRYAEEIEKAGILEHMNKHVGHPSTVERTASGRAKNVMKDHPNLKPAEAYLQDHHVDILQVGQGKGTYSVGEDKTGHGLPRISGQGQWRVREKARSKHGNTRTVQFMPKGAKGLKPSHVNLDKDEHLEAFAKTLGH